MDNLLFPPRPPATPTIYAFAGTHPDRAGLLMVGQTTRTAGGRRDDIAQVVADQAGIAGIVESDKELAKQLPARGKVWSSRPRLGRNSRGAAVPLFKRRGAV